MQQRTEEQVAAPHWTMDRRVNVAHILTTLALAGALFVYLQTQEARLIVLEEHRAAQLARDLRQDQDARDLKVDINETLKDMRNELRLLRERTENLRSPR